MTDKQGDSVEPSCDCGMEEINRMFHLRSCAMVMRAYAKYVSDFNELAKLRAERDRFKEALAKIGDAIVSDIVVGALEELRKE